MNDAEGHSSTAPTQGEQGTFAVAQLLTPGREHEAKTPTSRGFAFLMNVGRVPEQPVEIIPGHVLRQAHADEIRSIKETLRNLAVGAQNKLDFFWEHVWPHPGGPIQILPQGEWRYFVIAFEGTTSTMSQLEQALALADPELLIGFTLITNQLGSTNHYDPERLFHALPTTRLGDWEFHEIDSAAVQEFRALHNALATHNRDLLDLYQVSAQLVALNAIKHDSSLRFLGYFALLESMLAHKPKPTDPYESITRQVKQKLVLLNHRFQKPVDIARFDTPDLGKIWSKMYSYRSVIAHGGVADFKTDLKLLKSPPDAMKLLTETTRAVTRQALSEPQLLVDLREC